MQVIGGSPSLVAALERLVALLTDAGATFHPGLRIVHSGRELSVRADGAAPWLMRIPMAMLVPVEGIVWSDDPPLRIVETRGLTAAQQEVLASCVDVMREAGTWEHYRVTHPRATISDPHAISVVQSLHPAFSPATSASAMLRTRTIRMSIADAEPASYLMPMLDLVNHHPHAPVYLPEDGYLGIATAQDSPGGECFVSYGSAKDVLGIALAYGFLDERITRANALPGEYDLPGGGMLRLVRASHTESAPEQDSLTVVGAAFDVADPGVTRLTLREPIEHFLRARGTPALQARHTARVLVRQVAADNAQRLAQAASALKGVGGADLVRGAVARQGSLVRSPSPPLPPVATDRR